MKYTELRALKPGIYNYLTDTGTHVRAHVLEEHIHYYVTYPSLKTRSGVISRSKVSNPMHEAHTVDKSLSKYSPRVLARLKEKEEILKHLHTDMFTLTFRYNPSHNSSINATSQDIEISYREHLDTHNKQCFKLKEKFLKLARKCYQHGIWCTEFTEQGAVHFHIKCYAPYFPINYKALLSLSTHFTGSKNGLDLRSGKGSYLSYISKESYQKSGSIKNQRLWGSWGFKQKFIALTHSDSTLFFVPGYIQKKYFEIVDI